MPDKRSAPEPIRLFIDAVLNLWEERDLKLSFSMVTKTITLRRDGVDLVLSWDELLGLMHLRPGTVEEKARELAVFFSSTYLATGDNALAETVRRWVRWLAFTGAVNLYAHMTKEEEVQFIHYNNTPNIDEMIQVYVADRAKPFKDKLTDLFKGLFEGMDLKPKEEKE